MDKEVYIEAISYFEHIINDQKMQYEPSDECKNILKAFVAEKLDLVKQNIKHVIPSTYYHDLFSDCFDYHQKGQRQLINKLVKRLGINRTTTTKKYRKTLGCGSECEIYSHSKKLWLKGEVFDVYTDKEGEWLKVKYGDKSPKLVKDIQRFCNTLRVYKWPKRIHGYLSKQYPMIQYEDDFRHRLTDVLRKCYIKYDKKMALRIKTVLIYYKFNDYVVPDFNTFISETNIPLESYAYENFREKYKQVKDAKIEIKTIDADRAMTDEKWNKNVLYDMGIFMRYEVNNPRFESLAEEIICNDIFNISNEKFNGYLSKAKEIHLENSLIMLSSADELYYGIEKFSPISIQHIIAIIIHTEETNYSRAFTQSFLSVNQSDSEIVIQNHCNNFYWFGRNIFECIEFFGEIFDDEDNNVHQLQGSTVLFKFNLFLPSINYPRATTQSMDLAQHYCDNGIIIELKPKYTAQLNMTKFIDLSLMSQDYDVEKRLFFGKGCAMQIANIIIASNQTELKKFVAPLLYLEKVCLQTIFNYNFFNAKHIYNDVSKIDGSNIQKTLSHLLSICMDIRKIQRSIIPFSNEKIKSITNKLIPKYFPMQTMSNKQHIAISYIIDLLLFWCEQREFLSFESFPAELPFMSTELKRFFMGDEQNITHINLKNIQILMPNIKYYRDCTKQVKYIEAIETEISHDNIIDIINHNLQCYYIAKKGKDFTGKFKAWCKINGLTNSQVYIHINNATSKYLCQFDPNFPDKEVTDVFDIIKQATVPRLLWTLYLKKPEVNAFSPNTQTTLTLQDTHSMVSANNINTDSVYQVLSNCQRHEVPGHIVAILSELNYFKGNDMLSPSEFKDKYRNILEKYYNAIIKLSKATKYDFIHITEEINKQYKLFDERITEQLCDRLIEKLLTDIERTKPWKCSECWFINRKIMVNGLWRLYNQLNICGMCGASKDIDNNYLEDKKQQQILSNIVDESKETDLTLPEIVLNSWERVGKSMKCSLLNQKVNKSNRNQDFVENWDVKHIISFVTEWMLQLNDAKLNMRKQTIENYFEQQAIDGQSFLSIKKKAFMLNLGKQLKTKAFNGKLAKLHAAINEKNINCNAMKRIGIILNHFHFLTEKLCETNNRYPYLIRQFLSTLNETNRTQLLDDFDHIKQHNRRIIIEQPYVKCEYGNKCIHLKRAQRDNNNNTLKEKQELFNCNDWKDFVFISYLDKIHCSILHSTSNIGIKKDEHTIHRYSKFEVFSSGVFFQYDALAPLHANLQQELTNNVVYPISKENFTEAIFASKNILNTQKMKEKQWRAVETNDVYGIKIGDQIHIQHIICIYLYCSNSELCTKFRESYRPSQFDDNNTQIRSYHINNFYWMGRFVYVAIQFFGQKPSKDDTFYHGQNKQFLFTEFSTILEAPTSTTSDWKIAKQKFSGENGIVLKLGAKFKYELNNNKYLNVSSISAYGDDEKEKLFAGMTVLAIIDIGYSYLNKWYWLGNHTKVFLYFERLITQTIHQRNNYNYGFVSKKMQKKYLIPLIDYQMNRNMDTINDYKIQYIAPERHYLYALFEHFCDSKHDYINLTCIKDEIKTMHTLLINILFTTKSTHKNETVSYDKYEIDNDSIKLIFPKLKGYKNHLGYWINFGSS